MSKKRVIVQLAVLFLAICAVKAAPQSEQDAHTNVSGTVVDLTGVAIDSAHVWIHEQGNRHSYDLAVERSGRFSIAVPVGYYYVVAGSRGFAPYCKSIWVKPNGSSVVLTIRLGPDIENMQTN